MSQPADPWRPQEVLLEAEMHRVDEFVELCEEQLLLLAGDAEPLLMQRVFARSIAADLWRYDREVGDVEHLRKALAEPGVMSERSTFRIADHRTGLQGIHVAGIRLAREAHEGLVGVVKKGKVLPLRGRG